MGSIAGYTQIRIEGEPKLSRYIFADITRLGVAGKAHWITGFQAPPRSIRTYTGLVANTYGTQYNTYNNLTGSLVTVVDDLGLNWYNMFVHDVTIVSHHKFIGSSPTNLNYLLICDWELEHIQVA